jgi:hypothetical protein
MEQDQKRESFRQRWAKVRATKKAVFWIAAAAVIVTLIVGFNWGGWVTGGSARSMSDVAAEAAVVQRLAPICVAQFNQDPAKEQKLSALNEAKAYERDDYVRDQGWATMPGEEEPDRKVSEACAKLLMQVGQ